MSVKVSLKDQLAQVTKERDFYRSECYGFRASGDRLAECLDKAEREVRQLRKHLVDRHRCHNPNGGWTLDNALYCGAFDKARIGINPKPETANLPEPMGENN